MKRTQVLNLGKHFSIIDSPVPFYLIDNYGFRAYRPAGAWQFDNWKLLPEKFHKNYPVYTLFIEWESGENDNIRPEFTDTDLDLGDGIAGVNGQPVNISNSIKVSKVEEPVTVSKVEESVDILGLGPNNIIGGFNSYSEYEILKPQADTKYYAKSCIFENLDSTGKILNDYAFIDAYIRFYSTDSDIIKVEIIAMGITDNNVGIGTYLELSGIHFRIRGLVKEFI